MDMNTMTEAQKSLINEINAVNEKNNSFANYLLSLDPNNLDCNNLYKKTIEMSNYFASLN